MRRNAKARLLRDNVVVAENLTISSLKREKDDATEVREGYECGLTLTYSDIKVDDVIETYELRERSRATDPLSRIPAHRVHRTLCAAVVARCFLP